jgi:hypothetical protein
MRRLRLPHRPGCTAALLMLPGGRQLHGQAVARDTFAAMRSDSAAWQRVLVYVVRALSPELVRAAADTAAQPWDVRLPPDDPQRQLLAAQLRAILRARAVTPADSVTHRLEIGALQIVNDTALVGVHMQETRRCPGTTRTTGFGWTDTVRVPRHPEQKFWGAAFSRVTLAADRVGC